MQQFLLNMAMKLADWIYNKVGVNGEIRQIVAVTAFLEAQEDQVVNDIQLPKFQDSDKVYVKFHLPRLSSQTKRDQLVREAGKRVRQRIYDELERDVKVFVGYDSRAATLVKSDKNIKACRWVG